MRIVIIMLSALLLLYGCNERIEPGQTETPQPVVSGLQTLVVAATGADISRSLSGTIVSTDRAVLAARISGQARPLVKEGMVVKRGQALLEITGETATAELKSARAAVAAAQSQLAESRLHAELSEKNYTRYNSLYEKGALTALEHDRVLTEKAAASQRLNAAEATLSGSLARQEAALTMAGMATLLAPYDATVVEILVDAGTTVHPGAPLCILDRAGLWQVRVAFPEAIASRYLLGDTFPVEIPALAVKTTAILAELLPTADPQTRTVTAKLALPEINRLQGGMYAKVGIPGPAGQTRLVVPASAVMARGQLTSVYVVKNQTLEYRLVKTGPSVNDQVEILSGLQADDVIVVNGLERARHGARLESPQ